ncbi:hypothetical protein [Paludibacterium denitrificans]|uniref:hypothetical protein n=1 Tax=Paludibacterium denitrificans TaxID=2675226 RepID=UPI001E55CD3B|nr:hypothetical protein [Paludibacterium denitrificans]
MNYAACPQGFSERSTISLLRNFKSSSLCISITTPAVWTDSSTVAALAGVVFAGVQGAVEIHTDDRGDQLHLVKHACLPYGLSSGVPYASWVTVD